ncbi:MAG TPA: hypothetical protein VKZ46_01395 [Pedomonas sp.]|nr:hypothetical protein [Pedomonas sp.]
MKRDIPTRMNGRIPTDVQRFRAIQVTSIIGTGEPGDPYRSAVSIYRENGQHIVTVSDGELLALAGDDARRIVPEQREGWVRAWRNRFVSERMNAYPNDPYEVRRAKAESDANDFEESFAAEMAKRTAAPLPTPPNPEGSGSPEVKS